MATILHFKIEPSQQVVQSEGDVNDWLGDTRPELASMSAIGEPHTVESSQKQEEPGLLEDEEPISSQPTGRSFSVDKLSICYNDGIYQLMVNQDMSELQPGDRIITANCCLTVELEETDGFTLDEMPAEFCSDTLLPEDSYTSVFETPPAKESALSLAGPARTEAGDPLAFLYNQRSTQSNQMTALPQSVSRNNAAGSLLSSRISVAPVSFAEADLPDFGVATSGTPAPVADVPVESELLPLDTQMQEKSVIENPAHATSVPATSVETGFLSSIEQTVHDKTERIHRETTVDSADKKGNILYDLGFVEDEAILSQDAQLEYAALSNSSSTQQYEQPHFLINPGVKTAKKSWGRLVSLVRKGKTALLNMDN